MIEKDASRFAYKSFRHGGRVGEDPGNEQNTNEELALSGVKRDYVTSPEYPDKLGHL